MLCGPDAMHGIAVQQCMVSLCSNAWYRCAAMHGIAVQQCMVPLCSNAWYRCAAMHGTVVQQCMVLLCSISTGPEGAGLQDGCVSATPWVSLCSPTLISFQARQVD
jgi:hypothetical protein